VFLFHHTFGDSAFIAQSQGFDLPPNPAGTGLIPVSVNSLYYFQNPTQPQTAVPRVNVLYICKSVVFVETAWQWVRSWGY